MKEERVFWIDDIRGFAMLSVIVAHAIERSIVGMGLENSVLWDIRNFIHTFHMPLFFLISGYLYFLTKQYKKSTTYFFKSRFVSLMMPYVILAFAVWGGKFVLSNFVTYTVTVNDLLLMFLNPISYLWFIYILFFAEVFQKILDQMINNRKLQSLIILLLVVIRCFYTPHFLFFDRFLYYPLFYFAGIILCENQKLLKSKQALVISIFVYLISMYAYLQNDLVSFKIIENLAASYFVFIVLKFICNKNGKNIFLNYIGINSMYFYIIHPIVITGLKVLFIKLAFDNAFVDTVLFVSLTCVCCGFYSYLADKYKLLSLVFKPTNFIKIM